MSKWSMERILAVALFCAALVAAPDASASTVGALGQLPGLAGCLMDEPVTDGCATGRNLGADSGAIAASPDGLNVYVANEDLSDDDNEIGVINVYRRDAGGALVQLAGDAGCISTGGEGGCNVGRALGGAKDIAVSPDGANVYVAAAGARAIAVLDRNLSTGELTQVGPEDESGCVSQDGSDGELSRGKNPCQNGRALDGVHAIAVSPNGDNVYAVAGSTEVNGVAVFSRNSDGTLDQPSDPEEDGCISDSRKDGDGEETCADARFMYEPNDLVVSTDGANVYVAVSEGRPDYFLDPETRGSFFDHGPGALVVLDRNLDDGALTQAEDATGCLTDLEAYTAADMTADGPCTNARGLQDGKAILMSPDDRNVYMVSQGDFPTSSQDPEESTYPGALTIFSRDGDGDLVQLDGHAGCATRDGSDGSAHFPLPGPGAAEGKAPVAGVCATAKAMSEPSGLAITPDGATLFVMAEDDNAVVVFARDAGTGAVTQYAGDEGCIGQTPIPFSGPPIGGGQCAEGRGLNQATKMVVVGPTAYVVSLGGHEETASDPTPPARGGPDDHSSVASFAVRPPTSATTAPGCTESGQVPVTVTDAAGGTAAKRVHFRIDGGAEQVANTTAGAPGAATISLPAGVHTLEFWGESESGLTQPGHHVARIQVGGCTPATAVAGAAPQLTRTCTSRRTIRMRIAKKALKGRSIRSVTVRLLATGKALRVRREGRTVTARVNLSGLPKGRFKVAITVRLRNGKVLRGVRRYRTCTPRVQGGIPPL